MTIDRRAFLGGVAAAASAVAGCSASGASDRTTIAGPTVSVPERAASYLSDVGNFDGVAADETGSETVSVAVGAPGNGGHLAFAPPAVAVSTGTTVRWEWTGEGGAHNVVAEDGTFDSGSSVVSAEETFEYTFEATGTYRYYCTPHKPMGMKGVVIVE